MNKTEKEQLVEELSKAFKETKGVLLINFMGINVPDATELRRKVGDAGSDYRVVKNTLALRAAKDSSVEKLKEYFDGPTAIAYTDKDPIALAKVITQFAKDHPIVKLKAGVLEGTVISGQQVEELANLPSREQLLSKVLYLLNAPVVRLATALNSPLQNLAWALQQIAEKKQVS